MSRPEPANSILARTPGELRDEFAERGLEPWRASQVTRRLYELGRARGYLLFHDREDRTLRIPVRW